MINWLHARFHRPEKGWDPVPLEHAVKYSADEWQGINEALLDELEQGIGGFQRKRILDLGGGPGQYSVAFAKRGGEVTWHDVSRIYRDMAQEKAEAFAVADRIQFSLGYLDEAPDLLPEPYDFVFNRICWNYGFSDRSFAKVLYRMVRPGGFGYVDTNHSEFKREQLSASARFRAWLNDAFAIKIGHPFPPHARLARLFLGFPMKRLVVDYRSPLNDRILFEKPAVDL
jgi:SAM-dependent methyltransferase